MIKVGDYVEVVRCWESPRCLVGKDNVVSIDTDLIIGRRGVVREVRHAAHPNYWGITVELPDWELRFATLAPLSLRVLNALKLMAEIV